jgi:tetratricopeptide (TPR) repeat protein
MGHGWISNSYDLEGNLPKAIEYGEKFQYTSIDPFYFEVGRAFLGVRYASNGQIDEAEKSLQKTLQFNKEFGIEFLEPLANIFLGVVYIAKGRMSYGLNLMKEGRSEYLKAQNIPFYCLAEYSLGKVYLEIAKASGKISPTEIIKNIGFIVKNAPRADKKAITHFNKAIEVAKEIGSRVILGLAYFDLGVLHQAKKRTEKARQCISEAVNIFEQCEANAYLKQAKEALESLE